MAGLSPAPAMVVADDRVRQDFHGDDRHASRADDRWASIARDARRLRSRRVHPILPPHRLTICEQAVEKSVGNRWITPQ